MTRTSAQSPVWAADKLGISAAAGILRSGGVIGMPTETVYGLAADATNAEAVARIFEVKGRPEFNPLIVHVAGMEAAQALVEMPAIAQKVAEAFWPGPLTLVLPMRGGAVSDLVAAGNDTLAIRMPAHPAAQALLRAFGGPIAAPSANPSGRISPTRVAHVQAGLGDRIDGILDGGDCTEGIESTILGFDPEPVLLRPGSITAEMLEAALGTAPRARMGPDITAPGQLASHYAPSARVRLNARDKQEGEFTIGFGAVSGDLNLSVSGDLREAAANLFAALHKADQSGKPIAVAPVPSRGLGRAINDRLGRAAAPRP